MSKTSANGRKFIKEVEGVEHEAYLDSGGVPTIGVGHTLKVHMGDVATDAQIDAWLADDLNTAESGVNNFVHVPLNQNEFDALVSFVFNVGVTAFRNSTLLRKLNAGDREGASKEFARWNKVQGKEVKGLSNRREKERKLFVS